MIECRSLLRDFLRTWKEKLEEEVVVEDDDSNESSTNDASTDGYLGNSYEPKDEKIIAESMLTKTSRNKFVWTKRAVRIVVRRYERYPTYFSSLCTIFFFIFA